MGIKIILNSTKSSVKKDIAGVSLFNVPFSVSDENAIELKSYGQKNTEIY